MKFIDGILSALVFLLMCFSIGVMFMLVLTEA